MKDEYIQTQCTVGGWPLAAKACRLQDGVTVLLTGGCRTHIGAISVAAPGRPVETISLPGHREAAVTEPFAQGLCRALGVAVCVTGGIHYDNADRALLDEVVAACRTMGQNLLEAFAAKEKKEKDRKELI